jgi:hypothetical protein
MALTNKQKHKIMSTARDNGYKGDYLDLFQEALSLYKKIILLWMNI